MSHPSSFADATRLTPWPGFPKYPLLVIVLLISIPSAWTGEAGRLRIAAASDLTFAFEELSKVFVAQGGQAPAFIFGSTGLLAKQMIEGAPFDVFAAANVSFVDQVITAGAGVADTKALYARGRISLWWRSDLAVAPPLSLADLADGRFRKIALANPEHAPYGKAGQEALTTAKVWKSVQPRLVLGENVRQTLQFAESGNAEVAIVALSLSIVTKGGASLLIDEAAHQPIDQAVVLGTRGANPDGGRAFIALLASPTGRALMRRYGFLLPNETVEPTAAPAP